MRKALFLAPVLALLGGLTTPAMAEPAGVSEEFGLPAHVELDATAVSCTNKGSTVEFTGTLTLDGVTVDISFQNNWKGTHKITETGEAFFEVTPASGTWTVPKQPVKAGAGGNPWISIQFDGSDERIVLGRCVQGIKLAHISEDLLLDTSAAVWLQSLECSNRRTWITLTSTQAGAALDATLYMDNNINKVVHEAETDAKVRVRLLGIDPVSKKGSVDGPGGNPIITVQFVGDDWAGDPVVLGRCVKLG